MKTLQNGAHGKGVKRLGSLILIFMSLPKCLLGYADTHKGSNKGLCTLQRSQQGVQFHPCAAFRTLCCLDSLLKSVRLKYAKILKYSLLGIFAVT